MQGSFTHVTVGTNDIVRSRKFYDAVLSALGWSRLGDMGDSGSAWGIDRPAFLAVRPINGEAATFGNGATISFQAPSSAAVTAFHTAALRLGSPDEGPVGPRPWAPDAVAAYTRDPDGNKLAVYFLGPQMS
jgi:catechol 2,3-dioxygenase-like lactoylglutathione lyase family enzyme